MSFLLRGALIEYGNDLIGPIPNIVIFQFNPETLTRTMEIPQPPGGGNARETSQSSGKTYETIAMKAQFSAADELGDGKVLARAFGIGPRLAALEKMVQTSDDGGLLGAALDAIGDALGLGGGDDAPSQPIPREKYPRTLFIWGLTRVLPVRISSMRVTEQEYDFLLNPVRADVDIEMTVMAPDPYSSDPLAEGALMYTKTVQDVMAVSNLANTAEQIVELIPI